MCWAGSRTSASAARSRKLLPPDALPPIPAAERPLMAMVRHWMLFKDPPDHGRLRRLAAPVFRPADRGGQRGPIERLAQRQLERLPRGTAVDIVGDFAYPLSIDVVSEPWECPRVTGR